MNTRLTSSLFAALLTFAVVTNSRAQTTAFTYQGRLTTNNAPANGRFDFEFSLFSAESGGTPANGPLALPGVGVTNGIFTASLNFGSDAFDGQPRWLGITVRPMGGGIITPLHPRQPITPTPYAVVAWSALSAASVPGLDGYSLDASDGSVIDALFVDGAGEVGIGTTEPAAQLHVVSAPRVVVPPRVESIAADGFAAGWDFYHNGVGKGYVGVPDAGAGIGHGELILFGGAGTKVSLWGGQIRALTADTAGNVRVSGDVQLGSSGQFRAASGDESLRIVRGMVGADGTILRGLGFTVTRATDGDYQIAFTRPFSEPPVLTVSQERTGNIPLFVQADEVTVSTAKVFVQVVVANGTFPRIDTPFHFIAVGPR